MQLTGWGILLSWIFSVALHGAGLAAMFALIFPYAAGKEANLPVVRAEVVGDLETTSFHPSQTPDLPAPLEPLEPQDIRFTPRKSDELSRLTTSKKPELSIIGIGAGGGDFSQYGLTAGPGTGPVFFGLGGSARGVKRIVYVVDRSGSMLDTFVYVREELKQSIQALRRSQKFHVIFFNAGRPLENTPRRLVSAIQAQKAQLFEFLDNVHPEGGTNPEPAMRRALAIEPDLIYFLTDGEFDHDLVERLDDWNRGHRVKIFTIAYFDRRGAAMLERIAREHGGVFKFVSEDALP